MKNNIYKWLLPAVLLLATAAAYWQLSNSEFVNFDDPQYIYENPKVMMGLSWESIKWAFTKVYASNWHPLTWISLMLDWELFGKNAGGFHLVNLGFHLVNTLLLYILLKKSTKLFWPSFFVSAFFALHPLHVESVAWIVERKDVLSTLFWLLTMIAYAWYTKKISVKRYLLVAVFFILGLMSKPMLVTLPIILLLWDFWPLDRINFNDERRQILKRIWMLALEKLPLIIITIISCAATLFAQKNTIGSFQLYSLTTRVQNALVSYYMYIAQTFWPVKMAAYYPHPEGYLDAWKGILAGIFLLVVSFTCYIYGTKKRFLIVGWLFYLITLIPVIGFVQVGGQARADRYTYVPLIGVFIIITYLIYEFVITRKYLAKISVTAGFAVCIILGLVTYNQTGYWKNTLALFLHAVSVTEGNNVAHNNLGVEYVEKGNYTEGEKHFSAALAIWNEDYDSNYNLIKVYQIQNRLDEAKVLLDRLLNKKERIPDTYKLYADYLRLRGDMNEAKQYYCQAISKEPNDPASYYGLGLLLAQLNQVDEAINELKKSVILRPNAESYVALGMVLVKKGDYDEAVLCYEKAIELSPNSADAYYNMGDAYLVKQDFQKAADNFQLALKNDPNYFKAYGNLAVSLAQMGKLDEALVHMQKIIAIYPNNPDGYFNISLALIGANRYQEALPNLEKLVELEPNNPDNYIYLGNVFYEQKDLEKAAKAYQKALSIDPNHPKAKEGLQKISSDR